MTAPTIAEEKLLMEFRDNVKDALMTKDQYERSYLIRWLRARDLDLKKSEEMLRAAMLWRKENNVDKILEVDIDPYLAKEFPFYFDGIDKNGQPVMYVPMGRWDFRKVINEDKQEEFKLYASYMFETICKKIKERNKRRDPELYPLTQFTVVADWQGYSYMQLMNYKAIQHMLALGIIYEAYYPEILYRAFFINCPSFFNLVLALLRPILAPKTMSKITCHGWNREENEQVLRELIDVDQISIILKRMEQ